MGQTEPKMMKFKPSKSLGALLAAAALAAAALALPSLVATPAQAQSLNAADRALVERAGAYLNGLKSARGRFTQTDPNGRTVSGSYALKRPGKVRFEYDKPSGLLIVADGRNANIYDARLKTFDQSPLNRSPLSLFLSNDISVTKGSISGVTRSKDGFAFSARDRGGLANGYVTLNFAENPMRLTGWTVVDGQRRSTRVRLNTLTPGAVPDSLFVLNRPATARAAR
jgi:outer membrane lipoprotein-sorting protein